MSAVPRLTQVCICPLQVSRAVRTLTFLASGQTDCPQLFIISPVPTSTNKSPSFLNFLPFQKMKLYFLCGYTMEPITDADCCITLDQATEVNKFVKDVGPALNVVLGVLKNFEMVPLPGSPAIGMLTKLLADKTDSASQSVETAEALAGALSNAKIQAGGLIEGTNGSVLENVAAIAEKEEHSQKDRETIEEAQKLTGKSYELIKKKAEQKGVLTSLSKKMSKVVDADGSVVWCASDLPTLPFSWPDGVCPFPTIG